MSHTARTFRTEFPDFDDATAPAALLALGFSDQSWHNDVCPSFDHGAAGVAVWVDYVDQAKREFPEGERFSVMPCDRDGGRIGDVILYTGDALPDLLAFLHPHVIAHAFAGVLKEWANPDQWRQMRADNATPDYAGDMCASHDFCDANMAMHAAFLAVLKREPDVVGEAPTDLDLWDAAWSVARARYLTAVSE